MSELEIHGAGSPFDVLKRTDDRGEHWSAREVAGPLGYTWRGFTDAIERGRIALRVNGQDPDIHIQRWKAPSNGVGRAETRTDYRMTREGVYATIQGADPRKPEIAAAWSYFRTKTREAEVAPMRLVPDSRVPTSFGTALQLAAEQQLAIEDRDRQIEQQRATLDWAEPRAAYVDKFVDGAGDASTVRDLAKQVDVPERRLRAWMIERHLIYVVKTSGANEYRPRAVLGPRKHWFTLADQPQAPRYHNGQMRKTLYITPAGKTGVEALLLKYPITGQGEIDIEEAS